MNLKRLRLVLVVSFAFLSIIPLVFTGYKVKTEGDEMIKEKVFSHLLSISEKSSYIIIEFVSERQSDMRMLSSLFSLETEMNRERLTEYFRLMKKRYNVYLSFLVAGKDGEVVFSDSDCYPTEKNVSHNEWFKSANRGHEFISDVFLHDQGQKKVPAILISVPVIGRDGAINQVLAACVDFSKIDMSLSKTEIGRTGEVYLVNKNGYFITSSRLGAKILEDRVPIQEKRAAVSRKGIYELLDYRGQMVLHAYSEIKNHSWLVIAEQDKEEALSQVNLLNRNIFLLGVVLIVLIFSVAFLVSGRIVKFIERAYAREKELEFQVIQQEKLAALGMLTAGLAHELNTPLANALLYTQMIAEDMDVQKNAEDLERLAIIEEEIKHGSNIVRNLLEFSRHSRSGEKTANVNEIIEKLITIAQPQCSSNHIEIVKEMQQEIPLVKGEASIIQEVITNVFANACDIMQNGGRLKVKTRHTPVLKKVKVDISDTGPGIPAEFLPKVFDPFFSTKKQGEGTGLGLFMSYEMIRRIGGTIRVISSTGVEGSGTGTTFTIELPVAEPSNNNAV